MAVQKVAVGLLILAVVDGFRAQQRKQTKSTEKPVKKMDGWGVPPDNSSHQPHCAGVKIRHDEMRARGERQIEDNVGTAGSVTCAGGSAGSYPCSGVDLLSHISLSTFGQEWANDIWGWTDPATQKEYAIMGVYEGAVFVDISDPETPEYLVYVPSHTTSSYWFDIKVYNNRAYIVSEASGHGMQVYDLTRLRGRTAPAIQHSPDFHLDYFGNAHNIVINEETGRAYAVGANRCSGGLIIMDIRQLEPVVLGCFSGDGYTHDAQCVIYRGPDSEHSGKEICIAYNEDTLTVVDVTDASNPVQLSKATYPGDQYTHQGWFDEQQEYIYANDEDDETGSDKITKTLIFNAADLDNVVFVDKHRHPTASIDHNLYILNGFVYEGNYCAGLRILSIGNDHMLTEVGYFDMAQECNTAVFEGVWSVYPYFASGSIIVSSMEKGLFVLKAAQGTLQPPPPSPPTPVVSPTPTPAPIDVRRRRRNADMLACRRRSSSPSDSDYGFTPAGYVCSGNSIVPESPTPAPAPTPPPACVTRTESGTTCAKWTSEWAEQYGYEPSDYPNAGLGDHNCCRNPDGHTGDWCLTGSNSPWWEDC